MSEIIFFIGMWIGILAIQLLVYKLDKKNNYKNPNV